MNPQLQERLDQQLQLPSDYTSFLRSVQLLSSRSSSPSTSSGPLPRTPVQPIQQRPSGDPMDLNTFEFNTIHPASPPIRARSISPVQRQSLRQEGKCVRCGSWRHWVADCPQEPYRPSSPEQQLLRREAAVRRQIFRPAPGSQYPPGPTINQLYTSYNKGSEGYTSEQERKWRKELEEYESESDSVGSDLVRL